jgi:DNA-binding transcriptional MerR regulator
VALVFTVAEVARLLEQEDAEKPMTPRAIRYYARSGIVRPTGQFPGNHGSRLYTLADIGLLRTIWLLRHRLHMSDRAVWAIAVIHGEKIRQQVTEGVGSVVIEPASQMFSRGREDQRKSLAIDVLDSVRLPVKLIVPPSLERRARTMRAEARQIWNGSRWFRADEAAQEAIA